MSETIDDLGVMDVVGDDTMDDHDPELSAALDLLRAQRPKEDLEDLIRWAVLSHAKAIEDGVLVLSPAALNRLMANYACRMLSLHTGVRWRWTDDGEERYSFMPTDDPYVETPHTTH